MERISIYTFDVAKKNIDLAKKELEIELNGEVQQITAHEIGDGQDKHGEFFVIMRFDKARTIRFPRVENVNIFFETNQVEFWIKCREIQAIRKLETDKILNH